MSKESINCFTLKYPCDIIVLVQKMSMQKFIHSIVMTGDPECQL